MAVFEELNAINVNDKTEKKKSGGTELTYLSWTWAWAEVKKRYPDAHYEIMMHDGLPYVYDENTGYMVFTTVTIDGISHMMWLPVMDGANKAMKSKPYTYSTKYSGEKTVEAATMFDVNKTIMRCLVKNLAMFGLGLYVYAGEDIPSSDEESAKPKRQQTSIKPTQQKPQTQQQPTADPHASLIEKINSTNDVASLVSIYLDNTQEIESNSELKSLLTNRKKALQTIKAA